jgi:hypothetical protein
MSAALHHQHLRLRPPGPRAHPAAGKLQRPSVRPSHQLVRSSKLIEQLADGVEDPILRLALKDPVAFTGGVFAGALKLSLNEDPLRSWIDRTSALAVVSATSPCREGPAGGVEQQQAQAQLEWGALSLARAPSPDRC